MPLINFSGIASGIDTNSLIDATSEASRETKVRPLEERVDELEDTNAAFEEFKDLAGDLKDLLADLTSLSGGGVSKTAKSTDETVVSASATNAAANSIYTLNVTQLATNGVASFDARFSSSSTAIAPTIVDTGNSDISMDLGSVPTNWTFNITATTTYEEMLTDFNNNVDPSIATASFVNVGTSASPSYAMVINTTESGSGPGLISTTVGTDITTATPTMTITENTGQDATFSISGISGSITKSTNNISDVIAGITFDLEGTGSATISVDTDVAATTTTIQDIVDQYNDLVEFINDNDTIQRVEEGEEVDNIFGPLAGTQIDDNFLTSMRGAISSAQTSVGSVVRIFADLGIFTNRDGTLEFKQDDFEQAVETEPDAVSDLLSQFADEVASTSGTIDQFIRFNGVVDVAINGNETTLSDLRDRIRDAERSIARNEDSLRQRFARLESLIGGLQNQQAALSSALAQLG